MTDPTILRLDSVGTSLSGFAAEPPSIADLAADFPLEWHEAVAIILDTCRALAVGPMTGAVVPASNVRIGDAGTVSVAGSGVKDGPSAVSQVGEMLRDLLRGSEPVQLRLVMSQALANPPHYATLEAFCQALIYFERPDRRAIIRGVYQRWAGRIVGAHTVPAPSVAEPRKEPETKKQHEPSRSDSRIPARAIVVWSALTLVLTVMIAAGLTIWKGWSGSIGAAAMAARTSASGEVVGNTQATPDARESASPPPAKPIASSENRTAAVAPRPRTASPALLIEPRSQTLLSLPSRDALMVWENPIAAPVAEVPRSARPPGDGVMPADADALLRIYTTLDTDVVEPVVVYPNLPSAGVMPFSDETLVFDIIVSRTGAVESVKIRRAPASFRDTIVLTMSLSAAKAWRFQPATRNGQPVRYLKSIWLPSGYSY